MDFDPGLKIGEEINNDRLCEIFLCSGQGGMRKSNKTNTLVIVSKHVGRIYDDRWIGETLHYTGMGLEGDQGRSVRTDFLRSVYLFETVSTLSIFFIEYCFLLHCKIVIFFNF